MFRRRKPEWNKLASGLYVPPYLKFAGWYPFCGEEDVECEHCVGELGPEQFQVTIPAGTLINSDCPDCDSLNRTYILSFTSGCNWRYDFPIPQPCDGALEEGPIDYLVLDVYPNLVVVELVTKLGLAVDWRKSYGEDDPDCRNFDEEPLAFFARNMSACTDNGAAILVSAL